MSRAAARSGPEPGYAVCLGAQKCGTTWLYDYYQGHPQVHVPLVKEMHYFNAFYGPERNGHRRRRRRILRAREQREHLLQRAIRVLRRSLKRPLRFPSIEYSRAMMAMYADQSGEHRAYYGLLTDGMGDERLLLDITPSYALIGEDGFREILRFRPDARFVFIMRDPVDRTWSALRSQFANQRVPRDAVPKTLDEIFDAFAAGKLTHIRRQSDYPATLRALEAAVPADRLIYLFFETMFTPGEIGRLNRFLGLDDVPADFATNVFPGPAAELTAQMADTLRDGLSPVYDALQARFGDALPRQWRLEHGAGAVPVAAAGGR